MFYLRCLQDFYVNLIGDVGNCKVKDEIMNGVAELYTYIKLHPRCDQLRITDSRDVDQLLSGPFFLVKLPFIYFM